MDNILLLKKRQKYPNNIQNWMEINLSKSDYERLMREIPAKMNISSRTWYYYRIGTTEIGITKLQMVFEMLKPLGCTDILHLIQDLSGN